MTTAYYTHPDCRGHDMGRGHPECPQRLDAINDHLLATGLDVALDRREAPFVDLRDVALAHTDGYIAALKGLLEQVASSGVPRAIDPDTVAGPGTLSAALRAAGAAVAATDAVIDGEVENAFCAVRPPGHHATRDQAMGFCFFNNIAIAVRHALDVRGLQRVAVVDFDVHHGNGTEALFRDDPSVLTVSLHQWPFWPGTGGPTANADGVVNVPLRAGSGDDVYFAAFDDVVEPVVRAFEPEVVLVAAGFDAHRDDPLAEMAVTADGFRELARRCAALGPRVAAVLEGGYNLETLPDLVGAALEGFESGA